MSKIDSNNNTNHIFVNKTKYDLTADTLTGEQILALTGFPPDKYDLFLIHGNDRTKIDAKESVTIKNGMHFHGIIKNVQFG
jgi:Multiubiquitin